MHHSLTPQDAYCNFIPEQTQSETPAESRNLNMQHNPKKRLKKMSLQIYGNWRQCRHR